MIRRHFEADPLFPKDAAVAIECDFGKVALRRRGVVGTAYSPGFIHKGDDVIVCVPEQRPYLPPSVPVPG